MGQQGSSTKELLEDRYFLQKVRLGQGSFGTVWRAIDRASGLVVAIKQLEKARMRRTGLTREAVDREVAMMRACGHENIAQLLGTFEDSKNMYMAQEYCDGGDFGDKVRERGLSLQEPEAALWMRQVTAAVDFLHAKRICHRDVKPDNFMIRETPAGSARGVPTASSGSSFMLKLSDFGLAVYLPHGKLLVEKCGTPAFMAPEQHLLKRGSRGYGLAADVWAVGVTMYQVMLGGKHPFLNEQGNRFEEDMLLKGILDFRLEKESTAAFLGLEDHRQGLRYSNDARRICSDMVTSDPRRRITARDALNNSWFNQEGSRMQLSPAAASAPRKQLSEQVNPFSVSTTSTASTMYAQGMIPEELAKSVSRDMPTPAPYAQPAAPLRAFSEEFGRSVGRVDSGFLAMSEPTMSEPRTPMAQALQAINIGMCGFGTEGPDSFDESARPAWSCQPMAAADTMRRMTAAGSMSDLGGLPMSARSEAGLAFVPRPEDAFVSVQSEAGLALVSRSSPRRGSEPLSSLGRPWNQGDCERAEPQRPVRRYASSGLLGPPHFDDMPFAPRAARMAAVHA
mmetsp:Transcript_44029/g.113848  ORF Transcript_44029/g.113848 Transcript_44029/m.113848 type:complete len:566 (+) Transcript_44029:63-1760(+)